MEACACAVAWGTPAVTIAMNTKSARSACKNISEWCKCCSSELQCKTLGCGRHKMPTCTRRLCWGVLRRSFCSWNLVTGRWANWPTRRSRCWVNEELLIAVMGCSWWLRPESGAPVLEKGQSFAKPCTIWFMFANLCTDGQEPTTHERSWTDADSDSLAGTIWGRSQLSLLMFHLLWYLQALLLSPTEVTALALVHVFSHPINSWWHIMPPLTKSCYLQLFFFFNLGAAGQE